ncbi:MAG: Holliday junction branch migration protein RuvA [Parvularculaceae bacterium]|nr:Holliday junction branch migration protein RuvA [Parvularculaceae bacterium]
MIGRLKGVVAALDADSAVIDVNGVGYEIYAHARLLGRLALGESAPLAIETLVREDLIRLYAFESEAERAAFRLLQTVQGVGARHALSVLQVLPPDDLYDAVAAEDVTAIARAHGVGKKLAQRIAAELVSKVGGVARSGSVLTAAARKKASGETGTGAAAARADAVSALANLGYDGVDARRAVSVAAQDLDEQAGVGEIVKRALKELAA